MWSQPAIMERPPGNLATNELPAENVWIGRNDAPFPEDVRSWTGERKLADFIADTYREVCPNEASTSLAKALTYFYASGTYSSEEIKFKVRCGECALPPIEILCDADATHRIRQFRRRNRTMLINGLMQVLVGCSQQSGLNTAAACAREAERRINEAVRQDCWSADC